MAFLQSVSGALKLRMRSDRRSIIVSDRRSVICALGGKSSSALLVGCVLPPAFAAAGEGADFTAGAGRAAGFSAGTGFSADSA